MTFIINLLHKNNYVHRDLHSGNIGVVKTNQKFIKIVDKNIPTCGYIYKPIDYGLVINKKNLKNKNEENIFNMWMKDELPMLIYIFTKTKFWDMVDKKKINIPKFNKTYDEFKKFDEYNFIKLLTNNKYSQMYLFEVIYPENWQRLLLGSKFKKFIPVHLLIPIEDIIMFVKLDNDYLNIINYFIFALEKMD
jgi:hypothetical protein